MGKIELCVAVIKMNKGLNETFVEQFERCLALEEPYKIRKVNGKWYDQYGTRYKRIYNFGSREATYSPMTAEDYEKAQKKNKNK